ncbi:MAG: DUF4876 domain-containing protein [Paludibacteraceae bacterium]|nr:DUF4876 domain-containing protein [Paludibacteraceae bacterium]
MLAVLAGCGRETAEAPLVTLNTNVVEIMYPATSERMTVSDEVLKFTNRSTGEQITVNKGDDVTLLMGLYDCEYSAKAELDGVESSIYGSANSIVVKNSLAFSLQSYMVTKATDFIIEEIFFAGTLQPTGKTYNGDNYVKLYNPTDHVLYADGVAFCESKFTSSQLCTYDPDIRNEAVTVQAVYVVPGSGMEHPVQPGESFLICDVGIDHRVSNPNSIDLSAADMEWYDESSSASNMDIDSETVPNLDKWYCYTASFWILHKRGLKSYIRARIPVSKAEYLKDYIYDYEYIIHVAAGDFYMSSSDYKIPNSWVLDGVNCSVVSDHLWNILPPSIDAGWTWCAKTDEDVNKSFHSVRRKMLGLDKYGRRILKDTNNSTNDFNPCVTASLIEEQHGSTDVNGTKATAVTYDGVWSIE